MKFRTVLTGGKELKTKIIMGVAAVVSIMAMTGCSNSEYKYENVQEGEILEFGHYQTEIEAGKDFSPIEWYVLKKENGQALLFSKYVLACEPYGDGEPEQGEYIGCVWRDSELRRWLNDDFLNKAFTKEEQDRLLYTSDDLYYNGSYTESGEIFTEDRVSLLGEEEYFDLVCGKEAEEGYSTIYLENRDENFPYAWRRDWELVTPGSGASNYIVTGEGELREPTEPYWLANGVHYVNVRPVVWIKLDGYEKVAAQEETEYEKSNYEDSSYEEKGELNGVWGNSQNDCLRLYENGSWTYENGSVLGDSYSGTFSIVNETLYMLRDGDSDRRLFEFNYNLDGTDLYLEAVGENAEFVVASANGWYQYWEDIPGKETAEETKWADYWSNENGDTLEFYLDGTWKFHDHNSVYEGWSEERYGTYEIINANEIHLRVDGDSMERLYTYNYELNENELHLKPFGGFVDVAHRAIGSDDLYFYK